MRHGCNYLSLAGSGGAVLEVGTGCGYQTAVLAELVERVYSLEIIPELARGTRKRLERMGYGDVSVQVGDGHLGWRESTPPTTASSSPPPPPTSPVPWWSSSGPAAGW